MLKAIILDDEPRGARALVKKLQLFDQDIEVIAVFHCPLAALKEINTLGADVLFLDVEMPGMSGLEFLEQLSGFRFEVIFTTAYDTYTLDALRLSAVDYLLKPISNEDLKDSIERLKNRLARKPTPPVIEQTGSRFTQTRLPLSTSEGIYLIEKGNVIRVEAMSNYCTFYMNDNRKIVVSKTLKAYETLLSDDHFMRVNRSSIVNLNYISRYRRGNGGTLEMADGMEIEVSPQKKEELMNILFGE